jgi:hypothetical protein
VTASGSSPARPEGRSRFNQMIPPSYRAPHKNVLTTPFIFDSKEAEQAGLITLSTPSLSYQYKPVHFLNLLFSSHIV